MVQGYVEFTSITSMRRVWCSHSTLLTSTYLAYHYEGELSEFEATQRKLDALLFLLSSEMGVRRPDDDEDLPEGDGDFDSPKT